MDYQNKYLKYKQKYIDARARISNKNELMLNINKFENLDYATKYEMFGGNINNLRIAYLRMSYNLHGGGSCKSPEERTWEEYWAGKPGKPERTWEEYWALPGENGERTWVQFFAGKNKDGTPERTWEEYWAGKDKDGKSARTWEEYLALPGENGERTWVQYWAQIKYEFILPFHNFQESVMRGTVLTDTAILANRNIQAIQTNVNYAGAVAYSVGNYIYHIPYTTMNAMYGTVIMMRDNLATVSTNLTNFFTKYANTANKRFIDSVVNNIKISAKAIGSSVLSTVESIGTNITDTVKFIADGLKYIVEAIYKAFTEPNILSTLWISCCDIYKKLSDMIKDIASTSFNTINSTLQTFKEILYDIYTKLSTASYVTTAITLITASIPVGVAVGAITATISTILHLVSHVVYSIYGMVTVAWSTTIIDCKTYITNQTEQKSQDNKLFDSFNCGYAEITSPWSFMGWLWTQFSLPTNIATYLEICMVERIKKIAAGEICNTILVAEMQEELDKIKCKPLAKEVIYPDYVHVHVPTPYPNTNKKS